MNNLIFDLQLFAGENPGGEGGSPPDGGGGSSSSSVTWSGANSITSAATTTGQTYTSSTADENAVLISTTATVTLNNATVTKSGGTSASDNYSFYGINSAVMCMGGGTTSIVGGTVTTSAAGANGIFSFGSNTGTTNATGDGTKVYIKDVTISTTQQGSGGIMTTYGGTTVAENLTITTDGGSSAPIRTDRGGGWVTVTGGSYTSNGTGSPAIYSTAEITVNSATLVSNASEGVCIEGTGSIALNDCTLTASNNSLNGNATFYDTIMIYQSQSGDASDGTSTFSMTGGTLNSKNGHVFHVTNTTAIINLDGVTINNSDTSNVLLSVCDDGWSGASNIATLNATNQTLTGDILVGSDSTLTLNLTGSTFTGNILGEITNASGETVSDSLGTVNVTIDSDSKLYLTSDTYVTSFSGTAANVITNGYNFYVNGNVLDGTTTNSGDGNTMDISAGSYQVIDGIRYTASEDSVLNLTNSAVTGIASGKVVATIESSTTTPNITIDGTTAFNFTNTVDSSGYMNFAYGGGRFQFGDMSFHYVSGDATYTANGLTFSSSNPPVFSMTGNYSTLMGKLNLTFANNLTVPIENGIMTFNLANQSTATLSDGLANGTMSFQGQAVYNTNSKILTLTKDAHFNMDAAASVPLLGLNLKFDFDLVAATDTTLSFEDGKFTIQDGGSVLITGETFGSNGTFSVSGGNLSFSYEDALSTSSVTKLTLDAGATLTFTTSDSASSATVTTTTTAGATITMQSDRFTVTSGSDSYDVLFAAGSSDDPVNITNSASNTLVTGTAYADTIENSGDNITINTGAGDDSILSSGESDFIDAGAGNDTVGNNGRYATIDAGDGNDYVMSLRQRSSVNGGAGNDSIWTMGEYVTVNGGDGEDTITNAGANALIDAGAGNDSISISGENVTIVASAGNDTISGVNSSTNIQAEVTNSTISGNNVILTTSNGTLTLVDTKNQTFFLKGNDTVFSGEGEGFNKENSVSDTVITGTDFNDTIKNTAENVTINAGAGNDSIYHSGNNVLINAGDGEDTITNFGSNVTINAGAGNDSIRSYGNNVTIVASAGNDTISNINSTTYIQGTFTNATVSGSDVVLTSADGTITILDAKGATLNINGNDTVIGETSTETNATLAAVMADYMLHKTDAGYPAMAALAFHPTEPNPAAPTTYYSSETWTATSTDNLQLSAVHYSPENPTGRWVILVHGYGKIGAAMNNFADPYLAQGVDVLIVDERAAGNSEGEWLTMGVAESVDIAVWTQEIAKTNSNAQITLHGVSMGAATVMLAAALSQTTNVTSIIEDCGYGNILDVFTSLMSVYGSTFGITGNYELFADAVFKAGESLTGYNVADATPESVIAQVTVPSMFVHGAEDGVIPVSVASDLYSKSGATNKTLVTISGAGHATSAEVDSATYFSAITTLLGSADVEIGANINSTVDNENIRGTIYDDTITASGDNVTIDALTGNDLITAENSSATLSNATINLGEGADTVDFAGTLNQVTILGSGDSNDINIGTLENPVVAQATVTVAGLTNVLSDTRTMSLISLANESNGNVNIENYYGAGLALYVGNSDVESNNISINNIKGDKNIAFISLESSASNNLIFGDIKGTDGFFSTEFGPGSNDINTSNDTFTIGDIAASNQIHIWMDGGNDSLKFGNVADSVIFGIVADESLTAEFGDLSENVHISLQGGYGNSSIKIGDIGDSLTFYADLQEGNDYVNLGSTGSDANITISGGGGADTLEFETVQGNVSITSGTPIHTKRVDWKRNRIIPETLESIAETNAIDLKISSIGANSTVSITGGEDADNIYVGSASSSTVVVNSGAGNDSITVNEATNTNIDAGEGDNFVKIYHSYNNTITTGSGNDSVIVSKGSSVNAYTGDGDDTIIGTLSGDSDDWTFGGYAVIDAGAGNDYIAPHYSNNSSIYGGEGNDTIINNGANTTINGGAGNDYIELTNNLRQDTGDYEGQVIIASAGNDTIKNYSSNTSIQGTFTEAYNSGNNVILKTADGSITVADAKGKSFSLMDSSGNANSTLITAEGLNEIITIDNVVYNLKNDATLTYDENGKVTGITGGTVEVTLESSTSPQVTFNGETALNFSATAENGGLNITFSDVSLIYSSGTATYSATGIDFDEGTVFKKIDSSDVFVTFTVNKSDEGKISLESDSGIFVQPSTSDAVKVNLNLSTNSNQDYTGINGTATFVGNEIKLGSNTTVEGTANIVNLNSQLPFNYALSGGTGSLGFTETGSKMVADGTATLIGTITNSEKDIVIAINGGGTVSSQLDENRVHNTYLSEGINLKSNGDEYVFILENAGSYTLNDNTVTTTDDNVTVRLSNFDTVEFDIGAPVDYSQYNIQGESGNSIQLTQNSPSVIMYKQGTVNIEGSTFTLTEDDADGIKLSSSKENEFSVSRVISEDEIEKYGLDASDVGKVFEEVVEIKNDDTFSVQIAGNGIKQLDGLSSNAEIVNTAIFDGEIDPNGNYFFVSTDSEGKFKFGSNTYEISKDDNVTLKIAFDKDGDGTVSEISELSGTISGNFNEIESINDNEITISGGADNATVSVVDEDILIGTIAENATLSFSGNDISVLTTSTEITVNDVTYNISGDTDGVIVGNKLLSGLDANATLKVSSSGRYFVNNTWLNAKSSSIIVAVTEDYAYLFDENDAQFSSDTSVTEIADGLNIAEEKVQKLALNGDETVKLSDKGKNAAVVPDGASGTKVIELGDAGNAAIIGSTTALVTVTGGTGDDTLVSKGENVSFDMSEGGKDLIIALAGKTTLEHYNPTTEAGIKLTNEDAEAGVKFGANEVILSNATVDVGDNFVNIYTTDGEEEKIAFTTPEDKNLDYSSDTENLMLVANNASLTTEVESATLKTGSGNDTIYGGKGSSIDAGAGKNLIKLSDDGGATVSAAEGKNTLDNFNFVGGDAPADKLSTDSMAIRNAEVQKGNVILKNGKTRIQLNNAENQNIKFENQYTGNDIVAQFGDKKAELNDDATFYWVGGNNATVSIGEDYTNTETAVEIDLTNHNFKDTDTMSFKGDIKDVDAQDFAGAVEITGNDRYNKITAGKGGSTLDGGEGNDTLIGGEGSDTFIFGAGKDLISNFDVENDKLESANLAIEKVEIKGDNIVMITESGSKATIEGVADKTLKFENKYTQGTIEVQFSDDAATINNDADFYWFSGKNATVTLGSDSTLESANVDLSNYNFRNKDRLSFHGDVKTLDAAEYTQAATLSGSSWKNNVIKASKGGSELWGGGATNDTLFGGDGADTFIYRAGDGNDVIENATASDTVKLNNVTLDDISSAISGSDIKLNFNDGGTLTLKNAATSNVTFEIGSSSYTVNQTSGELETKNSEQLGS